MWNLPRWTTRVWWYWLRWTRRSLSMCLPFSINRSLLIGTDLSRTPFKLECKHYRLLSRNEVQGLDEQMITYYCFYVFVSHSSTFGNIVKLWRYCRFGTSHLIRQNKFTNLVKLTTTWVFHSEYGTFNVWRVRTLSWNVTRRSLTFNFFFFFGSDLFQIFGHKVPLRAKI